MQAGHELRKAKELEQGIVQREAKLKEREAELSSIEDMKRRNPLSYLEKIYGPEWYDLISKAKLDGVPPPQLIAAEVQEQVSAVRKETAAELEKLRKESAEQLRTISDAEAKREEARVYSDADSYLLANDSKYPHIFAEADAQGVKATLRYFIRAHFDSTTRQDEITGEYLPGELLSPQQAADSLEKLFAGSHEKRLKRLQPQKATTPAPQSSDSQFKVVPQDSRSSTAQQRRSLSTDMTGSGISSGETEQNLSESERRKRYNARWDALLAQRAMNS